MHQLCLARKNTIPCLVFSVAPFRLPFFLLLACLSFFLPQVPEGPGKFYPGPCQTDHHFPFQRVHRGVILLKAGLDNFPDSLNFILDTGSGGISLDSATVTRLSLLR